jgi:hypothetical protein
VYRLWEVERYDRSLDIHFRSDRRVADRVPPLAEELGVYASALAAASDRTSTICPGDQGKVPVLIWDCSV